MTEYSSNQPIGKEWTEKERRVPRTLTSLLACLLGASTPSSCTSTSKHHAFSGSLHVLYGNAKPIQADDGSGRGPARGLLRWAKVSVGSGDRRCRASSARGPSPTSFGVLGLTRARQSILARLQATRAASAAAAKEWGRGRYCGARHTPRPPFLTSTHARALATHRRQVWRRWRRERQMGGRSSREWGCLYSVCRVCQAGRRRRGRRQQRGRTSARGRLRRRAGGRRWRRVGQRAQRATTGGGRGERELS